MAALAVTLSAAGTPTELAVKGRSNATPSVGADADLVAIAWGATTPAGVTDVYAAVSSDGGRTFGGPIRVNDIDGDARLNGEQPPRVAVRDRGITIIWTAKSAGGTRLVQSGSDDGGKTFAKATAVPGGDAAGNRGWKNAAADRNGRVYAVWLDHRELAHQDGAVAGSHHDHVGASSGAKPDGVAMAQRSKLYFASLDGTVAPRALAGGVCYCCKTALMAHCDHRKKPRSLLRASRRLPCSTRRRLTAGASRRDGGFRPRGCRTIHRLRLGPADP